MTRGDEHLVFRLAGVLAAFGQPAIGERRPVWDTPSKSGVLGLVAAAMGLRRDDRQRLHALQEQLGYGVRLDGVGWPARDFQTAQVPRGSGFSTRRHELLAPDLSTVPSDRRYQADVSFTVALWNRTADAADLNAISAALKQPHFVLYLGRKSCPLSSPPRPRVVSGADLNAVFAAYDRQEAVGTLPPPPQPAPIWLDADVGDADVGDRRRRDLVRDRERWLFAYRLERRLPAARPSDANEP